MLSLLQCRSKDGTIEVMKATFLLNYSIGQEVLSAWSCVDQQRLRSGKISDLLK
jgi:hypothetical protein